jgi:hypothetical protein
MLKKICFIGFSLSLGFCTTEKSSSSLQSDELVCQNITRIFVDNQIGFLLHTDPIDYLAKLSDDELVTFSPRMQERQLKNLSMDLQAALYSRKRKAGEEAPIEAVRIESSLDRINFRSLEPKIAMLESLREEEIIIRNKQAMLRLPENTQLSLRTLRSWVQENLEEFDVKKSIRSYLPDLESKRQFLMKSMQGDLSLSFELSHRSQTSDFYHRLSERFEAFRSTGRGFETEREMADLFDFYLDFISDGGPQVIDNQIVEEITRSVVQKLGTIETMRKGPIIPEHMRNTPESLWIADEIQESLVNGSVSLFNTNETYNRFFLRDFFTAPKGAYALARAETGPYIELVFDNNWPSNRRRP